MLGFIEKLEADLKRRAVENANRRVLAKWTMPWALRVFVCKQLLRKYLPIAVRGSCIVLIGLPLAAVFLQVHKGWVIPISHLVRIGVFTLFYCWLFPAACLIVLRPRRVRLSTIGIEYGSGPKAVFRWDTIRSIKYSDSHKFPGLIVVLVDSEANKLNLDYILNKEFYGAVLPVLLENTGVEHVESIEE